MGKMPNLKLREVVSFAFYLLFSSTVLFPCGTFTLDGYVEAMWMSLLES